jgi:hypothetical protein
MPDYGAIAEYLDSGVSMVGASADEQLVPEVFRMWGASLDAGGVLRAVISSDARQTFEHARKGSLLCMTFADVLNLRSIQVKGRCIRDAEHPGPADLALMERYEAVLYPKAAPDGGPPAALLNAIRPRSVFAVSIEVEEAYEQTPGPAAGTTFEGS